jgi:hypothetical protein
LIKRIITYDKGVIVNDREVEDTAPEPDRVTVLEAEVAGIKAQVDAALLTK